MRGRSGRGPPGKGEPAVRTTSHSPDASRAGKCGLTSLSPGWGTGLRVAPPLVVRHSSLPKAVPNAPPGPGSRSKVAPESAVWTRARRSFRRHGANPSSHRCAVLAAVKESGHETRRNLGSGRQRRGWPRFCEVVVATLVIEVEVPEVLDTALKLAARASTASATTVRRKPAWAFSCATPARHDGPRQGYPPTSRPSSDVGRNLSKFSPAPARQSGGSRRCCPR